MSRILVLGDINLDVLARVPIDLPVDSELRTSVRVEPGGSAANFARAAASAGASVEFIGCVGDDIVGDILTEELNRSGVITHLQRFRARSGAIVSLTTDRGKTMLCSRGANDMIDPAFIDPGWFSAADHLHLSGYAFLSEVQRAAAKRAISNAQLHKMSISIDPPPENLIASFGVERFLDETSGATIVFPNLDEGKIMTGETSRERMVDSLSLMYPLGALTMGPEGAIAWDGDRRSTHGAERIDGVDPTGAGDAFAAAFVVSYLSFGDVERANSVGNTAAQRLLMDRAKNN